MADRRGHPGVVWGDWEGRVGTTAQMTTWHNASRAALYKRALRIRDGVWFLPAPKRPRP